MGNRKQDRATHLRERLLLATVLQLAGRAYRTFKCSFATARPGVPPRSSRDPQVNAPRCVCKVRVECAGPEDRYGDVFVDTNKSFQVYEQWLKQTRPAPGPDGLRRPLWFARAVRPSDEVYRMASTPAS